AGHVTGVQTCALPIYLYLNPEVARLENALYGTPPQGHPGGVLMPISEHNRSDLVQILLTGVPGLNFTGPHEADLLRLNTSIPPRSEERRVGKADGCGW